jgi:hypothetical protein
MVCSSFTDVIQLFRFRIVISQPRNHTARYDQSRGLVRANTSGSYTRETSLARPVHRGEATNLVYI